MLRLTTERLAFNPHGLIGSKVITARTQFSFNQIAYEVNLQTSMPTAAVVSGALRENRLDTSATLEALRSYQSLSLATPNRLKIIEGMHRIADDIKDIELLLRNLEIRCNRSGLTPEKKRIARKEIRHLKIDLSKLKVSRELLKNKLLEE